MNDFMKIGEFAKILNTTTKTLRHYETLGIFKPVYKDPITGYRYYDRSQLKEGYSLLSLKKSGISLKQINQTLSREKLIELFSEASLKLEDEILRLNKLKESVDSSLISLNKVAPEKGRMTLEIKELPERTYLILEFPPVTEIDSPKLYEKALELDRITSYHKLPFIFKGALLSLQELKDNKYSCHALIYEVEKTKNISSNTTYTSNSGRYLCLKYTGDTKLKNEDAMKTINNYIKENSLLPTGEVIGFSHLGAHTSSFQEEYYSEIQIKIR